MHGFHQGCPVIDDMIQQVDPDPNASELS